MKRMSLPDGTEGKIMEKKIFIILRWIAVLPGAIIAMFVAWAIVCRIIPAHDILNIIWVEISANAISVAAFIYAGMAIAPIHRTSVGVVLCILMTFFLGISFFIANWITQKYFTNIAIVTGVVTTAVCCIRIIKQSDDV